MGKNKYYCKLDGVVHNLSDVQEVLSGKSERNIVLIMNEEHGMDIVSANTFESVLRFHNNEIPSDYNEALRRWQEYNQASLSRCPRCGSTNIKYNLEFASWMAAQGQEPVSDSVLKDNKCGNCGFKW